jgi:hypothetical protein
MSNANDEEQKATGPAPVVSTEKKEEQEEEFTLGSWPYAGEKPGGDLGAWPYKSTPAPSPGSPDSEGGTP